MRVVLDGPWFWPARACRDEDTEVFFPTTTAGVRRAQAICASCPVLQRCAQWAQRVDFTEGVAASVLVPSTSASAARQEHAAQLLARVAAGEAAVRVGERKAHGAWRDPELQRAVFELRSQGRMPWRRVAARLGCSASAASAAYKAYTEQGAA
jgi:hypothetical protein